MADLLVYFHSALGTTSLYYFSILSIWGYVQFFRRKSIDSTYWGMLVIAELLIIAECLIGGYLWISGYRPARDLHILYGAVIPLMIPGAYFYTKGRGLRAEFLIYATATIIAVGLILRAIYTAQVVLPS